MKKLLSAISITMFSLTGLHVYASEATHSDPFQNKSNQVIAAGGQNEAKPAPAAEANPSPAAEPAKTKEKEAAPHKPAKKAKVAAKSKVKKNKMKKVNKMKKGKKAAKTEPKADQPAEGKPTD